MVGATGAAGTVGAIVVTFTLAAIKSDKLELMMGFGSMSIFAIAFNPSSAKASSDRAFSMESSFSMVDLTHSAADSTF